MKHEGTTFTSSEVTNQTVPAQFKLPTECFLKQVEPLCAILVERNDLKAAETTQLPVSDEMRFPQAHQTTAMTLMTCFETCQIPGWPTQRLFTTVQLWAQLCHRYNALQDVPSVGFLDFLPRSFRNFSRFIVETSRDPTGILRGHGRISR